MNQRKRTPAEIEADVLEKSGRRCCICFILHANFDVKSGQIAHLDRDPSNSKIDNLCFLCLEHHDDYDSKPSQSKGLTITEVKRYRTHLYDAIESRDLTNRFVNFISSGVDIPLLDYYSETAAVIEKTIKGTELVERQASIRLSDKDFSGKNGFPSLILSIAIEEIKYVGGIKRKLRVVADMPFGLSLLTELSASDIWTATGFVNVLRQKEDIWLLRGDPIDSDDQDPMDYARDYFLVYRQVNGENRLNVGTYSLTGALLQIHARFSEKVAEGLADFLENKGFLLPFFHDRRSS
jgi:hypothetical protein